MNKGFVILTEAGDNIGFGHLKRCLSLQTKFQSEKLNCSIFINVEGEYDFQNENNITLINWIDSLNLIFPLVDENTLVIIDSYRATKKVYDLFTKKSIKTIVIDDFNRMDYGNVQLILNPNPYFDKITYDNQTTTTIIGGEDHIILSTPFIESKKSKIDSKSKLNQICVCIGGSDYKNILPIVLNQISLTEFNDIIVITGNEEQIHKLKNEYDQFKFKCNLNSEEIYDVFQNSKLVISGCGQTLHELSSIGKKTIGICYDYDQKMNQEFYLKKSFLKYSLFADDISDLQHIVLEEYENDREVCATKSSEGLNNIYNSLMRI